MTKDEHDPSLSENDNEFDAIVAESYGDDELDLIEYMDTFYADSANLDSEAERLMGMRWQPNAQATRSMTIEMAAVSSSFKKVVEMIVQESEIQNIATEIAAVMRHDQVKRVSYFNEISTVIFEEYSSEEEIAILFQALLDKNSDFDHLIYGIMIFYQGVLMSQLRSLMQAQLKNR